MSHRTDSAARRGDMAWLLRTTNHMLRCRTLAALLDLAYDAIRDGLGYDRVGLLLVDRARQALVSHVGTDENGCKYYPRRCIASLDAGGYHADLLADPRLGADGPGFIYVRDAMRDLPPDAHDWLDGRPSQLMSVSLRTADAVLGLISVDNLTSGRPIRRADAPPLVAFANALAVAVENVGLLEQRARHIDDLNTTLQRRVDQLTWVQEAGTRLALAHDLDGVLDTIYACVRAGLGYDRVDLFLVETADDGRLVCSEVRGTDEAGRPTPGLPDEVYADDADLALRAPDLHYLQQGHATYYCADRWAVSPDAYRPALEGRVREQLAVALRHDGALVGYISVDNLTTSRPIAEDDAAPLVAFAPQAALSISRARLWAAHALQGEGLAQRVAELEWLREISRQVNAAGTLDGVLDAVYDGVRWGLGYDRVGINLFDRATGVFEDLRGTDAEGNKTCPTDRSVALADDSPIWQFPGIAALLRGAEFYYTSDAARECPLELLYLFDGAPAHNLMVPLRSGEKVTGMISVDNLVSGRPISPGDAGPLLALASLVGTAVENARLRERERAEHVRLQVLLESARALNSSLDRTHILHELAARLMTALDATSASFTAVDPVARTVRSLAHHVAPGRPPLFAADACEPLDDYPLLERLLATRLPFYGHIDDPDFPPSERDFLRRHDRQAELLVPVVVRGEATNVLEIHWDRQVAVGPETVTLCTAIAEQAAVALENALLYAHAAERAERDALTGLLNHRALLERLDVAVAAAAPFALLLLDVDNFKLFNDTYGHPVGDAVLTQVAATLRDACREGDAAGRYGGDEFALLLHGADAADAAMVARRLNTAVRSHPHTTSEGIIIPLSISVGQACFPAEGRTRQELLAVADQAMYVAKRGEQAARSRQAADLLGDSPFGVLEGLVNAVDAKDRYTREHSEDVTRLALLLAEAMGLGDDARRVLAIAGPLHDVGKIAVPDRILRKPGRLTAEEYALIKRHVAYGVAIIRGVLDDAAVVDAVAYHHERWDGGGYPAGTSGPATPLLGRIMQVADAVSAMMTDRPYRQGMTWPRVVAELRAGANRQFDPALVDAFIAATRHLHVASAS